MLRLEIERREELAVIGFYLPKRRLRISGQIHFVNDHDDLTDAEQTEKVSVSPALLADSFIRRDHEDCRIRARRARNHVLEELLVTRRIDDHVAPQVAAERNLRRVDRDVLRLLFE